MSGEFLPPVILKLVGDISNLTKKLAEASAMLHTWANTAGDDVGPSFSRDMAQVGRNAGRTMAKEFERTGDITPGMKRNNRKAEQEMKDFAKKILHFLGSLAPGGGRAMAVGVTSLIYGLAQLIAAMGPMLGIVNIAAPGIAALIPLVMSLKMAFHGLGAALQAFGKGDMAAFNEALAKMAPNMRAAVRAITAAKPALDSLRATVQQNFWAGFAIHIRQLAQNYFPMLRVALGGVALDLGNAVKWLLRWLNSRKGLSDVTTLFMGLRRVLADASLFLMKLVAGFINLARGGVGPLADIMGKVNQAGDRFIAWTERLASSGRLKEFIDNSLPPLKMTWDILKVIGQALSLLTKALNAAGQAAGGSGGAGGLLVQMVAALVSFLKTAEGMGATIQIFTMLNKVFTVLGGVFGMVLRIAMRLLPLVEPLIDGIVAALDVLVQGLESGLGPTLTQLVAALVPVIVALSNALLPVVVALTPALTTLAAAYGDVLVQAIVALTPAIVELANVLALAAKWLSEHEQLVKTLATVYTAPVVLIVAAISALVVAIGWIVAAVIRLGPVWRSIWGGVKKAFIVTVDAVKAGLRWLQDAPRHIVEAVRALPRLLQRLAVNLAGWIGYAIGYGLGLIIRGAIEGGKLLLAAIIGLGKLIWAGLKAAWDGVVAAFHRAWNTIVFIFKNPGALLDALKTVGAAIVNFFKDAKDWLFDAGKDLIAGLLRGIRGMWDTAFNSIKEFGKGLVNGFKDAVGIASPSKVFATAGRNIVAGLMMGIARDAGRARAMVSGLLTGVGVGGGGGSTRFMGLGGGPMRGFANARFAGASGGGTVLVQLAHTTTLDGKVIQRSQVTQSQRYKRRNGSTGLT